jgi:pyridoxamine 5'-phosphate oxidase
MALLPEILPTSPLPTVNQWLNDALREQARPNPNAMSLATVNEQGQPSVRVVLCKELQVEPGYLVFYTNYRSAKSADIESNPKVSFLMHWDRQGRQVRGEGLLMKSPGSESDNYFMSRDRGSRIGAWASEQSQTVSSREILEARFAATEERFRGQDVPRPEHWGGYRLWFTAIELWLSLDSRMHDRARWERTVEAGSDGTATTADWNLIGRLQP